MEAESFFARWAKRNAEAAVQKRESEAANVATAAANPRPAEPAPVPPTLDDVSRLTADSDFTRFVAPGVDETIRRSAMKKLFADPRFNVMDGLDVYIEDYNKFTPIPAAMLAALNHAKGLLDPLSQLDSPLMKLLEDAPKNDGADVANTDDSEAASGGMPEESHRPPAEDPTTHDDPVQGM